MEWPTAWRSPPGTPRATGLPSRRRARLPGRETLLSVRIRRRTSRGEAVYHRRVELDWDDVSGADSYQVQFYDWDARAMVVLPFKEITVVFDGSSAVVDKLTGTSFWWLQVRAVNTAGASEWSRVVQILPTKESDWEEDTNNQATGAPTIDGTAQVGERLTADTANIADADGLDNASFTYQWVADDADIDGATDSTYTLADSDQGKAIKVRASFTDDAGNQETLTSAATAAVAARPNNPATGAPTVSGTAQVDETLTADTSGIADSDGLDSASFSYQWVRNDGTGDAEVFREQRPRPTRRLTTTLGRPSWCGCPLPTIPGTRRR